MILDAGVVISGLTDEPGRAVAERLLTDRNDPPAMNTVNAGEVIDVLGRRTAVGLDAALERMLWLKHGGVEFVAVDLFDGQLAGALRAKYYDPKTLPVSFADCAVVATAIRYRNQKVATTDRCVGRLARSCDIEVVAVPNSRGEVFTLD